MNKKVVTRLLTFGSVAVGAYYAGCYVERQKSSLLQGTSQLESLSCVVPNFATVSAAVPMSAPVEAATSPNRIGEIMKYGFPSLDNIRSYSDFVLSYDRRNRVPNWVFEHLTAQSVASNDAVDRSKSQFKPDDSIHPFFRSDNLDYRRSGFDRGHMAAAGNHRLHQKHCDDTFFLTNMAPQVGQGFNRDKWENLESYVRKLTKTFQNVYVVTGPLYIPHKEDDGKTYVKYEVIGSNSVAVPTHFYKVVVAENAGQKPEMEAYVMPNKIIDNATPIEVFRVPPETIERSAGLLFFEKINRKQLGKLNGKKV